MKPVPEPEIPDGVPDGVRLYLHEGFGWRAWRWSWTAPDEREFLSRSYRSAEDAVEGARVFTTSYRPGQGA